MKIRGFELVSSFTDENLLPKRETAHAAGYDLKVAERTVIAPGEIVLVPTGVKAYMQPTEVLYLYDRSSNPRKKGLVLINSVGVIDGDYYGNPGNEGHIFAQMKNITDQSARHPPHLHLQLRKEQRQPEPHVPRLQGRLPGR